MPSHYTEPVARELARIAANPSAPLTHKEMTAHLRKRIKHEGIKARVYMQEYCGCYVIAIDPPVFEVEFSEDEQRKIRTMAVTNGLTLVQGMPINIEQMTDYKGFRFYFQFGNDTVGEGR